MTCNVARLRSWLRPYKTFKAKRVEREQRAKDTYRYRHGGIFVKRVPISFFRIASFPTIRKEDLMYLRINYVDGTLTTSTEKKTP